MALAPAFTRPLVTRAAAGATYDLTKLQELSQTKPAQVQDRMQAILHSLAHNGWLSKFAVDNPHHLYSRWRR
jgi:hypothetical protein